MSAAVTGLALTVEEPNVCCRAMKMSPTGGIRNVPFGEGLPVGPSP